MSGEGDVLLPLYDSQYSSVYTQLGARSMSADKTEQRWIGNVGVGQRWYPYAVENGIGKDAGNLMLGYNAFFDNDFTRSHQRAGLGLEAQCDWIHFASNYYAPLSNWKDSKDFDGQFVEERAARGWDLRAKGYLPFYRQVAVIGAFNQWYGDNVGMFGASRLEKDPQVWSYGLEYTPVPLISAHLKQQRSTEGHSDTEIGFQLTYQLDVPWSQQTNPAKVTELRNVGTSRHEFVDRENKIILEYRAKNSFHVDYLGKVGTNQFKFRVRNGFDKFIAGQQVRVSAGGGVTLAEANIAPTTFLAKVGEFFSGLLISSAHAADFTQTYTTDGNGTFVVRLDNVSTTPVVLTVQAGNSSQRVTITEATVTAGLTASSSSVLNGGVVTLTFDGKAVSAAQAVTWTLVSGPGALSSEQPITNGSGVATATLTANATGSDDIVVKATVNGKDYTITVNNLGIATLTIDSSSNGGNFVGSGSSTASVTAKLLLNGTPVSGQSVTWSLVLAVNSSPAMVSGWGTKKTGLTWGASPTMVKWDDIPELTATTTSNTGGDGKASIQLTDIVGERSITIQAKVNIGGTDHTVTQAVTYGNGPLSVFKAPDSTDRTWDNAYQLCNGSAYSGDHTTGWSSGTYVGGGKLPTRAEYQAVAPIDTRYSFTNPNGNAKGAAYAAGWPYGSFYWTGEADGADYAFDVYLYDGNSVGGIVSSVVRVACRR